MSLSEPKYVYSKLLAEITGKEGPSLKDSAMELKDTFIPSRKSNQGHI
jgi:hypothetical protein